MNTENLTVSHAIRHFHYTLYYYDPNGHLLQTVPPAGVKLLTPTEISQVISYRYGASTTPMYNNHTLATYYRYNTLDELVWQKSPDGGVSEFFYDRLGRIVLSQNAKQKPLHQYSYSQFDDQGRMTEVGQLTAPNDIETGTGLRVYTDMTSETAFNETALQNWFSLALPSAEQIVKNFYDANPFVAAGNPVPFTGGVPKNLRKNIAASATYASRNANCKPAHVTHYTYDYVDNVYEVIQEDSLLAACLTDHRYKKIEYNYDLITNKVNEVVYQRGFKDQYIHRYAYDADNRVTAVYSGPSFHRLDREAAYYYYLHGQVGRVEIGQRNVQGIDYAYTIMGWVKAVNSEYLSPERDMGKDGFGGAYYSSTLDQNFINAAPTGLFGSYLGNPNAMATTTANHSNFARDAFGYTLHYFQNDYLAAGSQVSTYQSPYASVASLQNGATNLYNGNISFSVISIPSTDQKQYLTSPQLAKYRYDQLNRIKSAVYTSDLNTMANTWNNNFGDAWANSYTYDPNGNIKTLSRNQAGTGTASKMDEFSYQYKAGTNQLTQVLDAIGSTASTHDLDNQAANNYAYDEIGNLVKDDAEGISTISWLANQKIGKINKTDGTVITFGYDATGQRITKKVEKIVAAVLKTEIEFYLRDASGNTMANYKLNPDSCVLRLTEQPIMGAGRTGVFASNKDITSNSTTIGTQNSIRFSLTRGLRMYELSNWLGNVQVVISDKKLSICNTSTTVAYYEADIQTSQDYYPFGMKVWGRGIWEIEMDILLRNQTFARKSVILSVGILKHIYKSRDSILWHV